MKFKEDENLPSAATTPYIKNEVMELYRKGFKIREEK